VVVSDPHRLDLRAKRAAPSQTGQEAHLHGGQDLRAADCDEQQVRRVSVDGVERAQARLQILLAADTVAGRAELVGGQQVHDRGDIPPQRLAAALPPCPARAAAPTPSQR
jgi:hypothetical protein